jgi:AraC family transcriptional regulator
MSVASRILPLLDFVRSNLGDDLSLGALAARVRRSPFELHRMFRRVVGETTKQYTQRLRLDAAAAALLHGDASVLDVALAAGFDSHEVFTRAFRRRFGVTPSVYREARRALDPRALARHAAVVATVSPCVGLYRLEDRPQEDPAMTTPVTTRDLTPQPVLVIRRKIAMADIAKTLGECLPAIFMHCQQHAIPLAGPPMARYVSMGPGLMTIEAGFPVGAGAKGEGEIELSELPGGPAAVAVHEGAYDKLGETHVAVERWVEAQKRTPAGAPWESYITDPGEKPDPKDWRTEVIWPLRPAR